MPDQPVIGGRCAADAQGVAGVLDGPGIILAEQRIHGGGAAEVGDAALRVQVGQEHRHQRRGELELPFRRMLRPPRPCPGQRLAMGFGLEDVGDRLAGLVAQRVVERD